MYIFLRVKLIVWIVEVYGLMDQWPGNLKLSTCYNFMTITILFPRIFKMGEKRFFFWKQEEVAESGHNDLIGLPTSGLHVDKFSGTFLRIKKKTSTKFSQACAMDDVCSSLGRWEDMNHDILVKIFQTLDIFDLILGIGQVCSTWRLAACDPLLWRTLDLSMLKSNFIKIPLEPYVYVDGRSDKTLTRVLKISLNLSRGNVSTIIFHYNLYISNDQLTYAAERCPRLKRLVMPAWNRIKEAGICHAIHIWKDLESLTMPSISNPPVLMEEISENCKNFSELKIMGPFDVCFASTLVAFLPNLKVLSLRCSMVFKDALVIILDGLKGLEVLNISHCLLVDAPPPPATKNVLWKLDSTILERTSKLKKFISCTNDSCVMCQRARNDEGLMRWYKYEEDLWKVDEVNSLAI